MPEEAIAMHAKLVEDMEKFSSIVNSKVDETVKFNEGIHAQLEQLLADFMAKINTIPEFQVDSCITINKSMFIQMILMRLLKSIKHLALHIM